MLRECRRAMRDIQSQLQAVTSVEDYFVESFVLVGMLLQASAGRSNIHL